MSTLGRRLTTALVPLAAAHILGAQDTVRTTSASWARALRPGTDTIVMYVARDGARQKMMTYIESISATAEGFLVVESNVRPDGAVVTLDSIALAAGTAAPLWHADVTPRGRSRVIFAGGRMTGTRTDTAGISTPVAADVPGGALDFSVASLLMRHLPLQTGYAVVLDTYDVQRGRVPMAVRVTGAEDVPLGGATVKAWRVEATTGGRTVVTWVDQATGAHVRTRASMGSVEMIAERP